MEAAAVGQGEYLRLLADTRQPVGDSRTFPACASQHEVPDSLQLFEHGREHVPIQKYAKPHRLGRFA